jgi:type IV secretory pathway VirB2 component (pilin)
MTLYNAVVLYTSLSVIATGYLCMRNSSMGWERAGRTLQLLLLVCIGIMIWYGLSDYDHSLAIASRI